MTPEQLDELDARLLTDEENYTVSWDELNKLIRAARGLSLTGSSAGIRVNSYMVLTRAIEEGISYGYRRAFKHSDDPDEDHIKDEIYTAIMNSICEVFQFDEP
jgi:hypothetical protein